MSCGRGKSRDDEQHQRDAEHADGGCSGRHSRLVRPWNGQRQQDECHRHQNLHGKGPPSFGLDDVDKRAPEGFDSPWQMSRLVNKAISPFGTPILVNIITEMLFTIKYGMPCAKYKGGNPCPWRYVFVWFMILIYCVLSDYSYSLSMLAPI